MNSFVPDFQKLYKIQDRVILALKDELGSFYLTGGTALGRFYLDHRYSEDLDFFVNADPEFSSKVNRLYQKIKLFFTIDEELSMVSDSYARLYLREEPGLKIDLVNDVPDRWGPLNKTHGFWIDNPANILSNKLAAILNRDEPKDVFDIVTLACNYSFNWREVYLQTAKKQLISETDIGIRLSSFPVQMLSKQLWMKTDQDLKQFSDKLITISNDLIFARDNSLGVGRQDLEKASMLEAALKS